MKRWNSIEELVNTLEEERRELDVRIEALKTNPISSEDEILLKYIETRSTVKVAEFIRSKGIRSTKGTVYAGSDVSSLIKEGGEETNSVLLRIAREIFEKNTKSVIRAYG